jgi:hypothetical protein
MSQGALYVILAEAVAFLLFWAGWSWRRRGPGS